MSRRRFSFADVKVPLGDVKGAAPEASSSTAPNETDWSKCFICQEDKDEKLMFPSVKKEGAGFSTIVENLKQFESIECLSFSLERLDEQGKGIEETLKQNNACIHNQCKLAYSKTRLQRAEKRKFAESMEAGQESPKFTRKQKTFTESKSLCFFCGEDNSSAQLHEASTVGDDSMDDRVRKCAVRLGDKQLLAKLSAGDLVAQEAKYHAKCLVSLYNRARDSYSDQKDSHMKNIGHGIALAELVLYINDTRNSQDIATVFKLRDLADLYNRKVEQLGLTENEVHKTRLKERLLAHVPDLQAYKQGREMFLAFNQDIGPAIRKAIDDDADDEGMHLVKAAAIVRRHMLDMSFKFEGTFEEGCQESAVPDSLVALVSMILDGTNIGGDPELTTAQSALSIAQLMQFNSHARRRKGSLGSRHKLSNETPLPIYLGLELHAQTRKRQLIDTMFQLGLSISYDRVLGISTQLGNSVCQQYQTENVVCPLKLRKELFTVAAVDNIDHNPSSTTAKDSFHGTGISLFQQPTVETPGIDRGLSILNEDTRGKSIAPLPESYTTINPVIDIRKDPPLPTCSQLTMPGPVVCPVAIQQDQQ